MKKKYLAVTLAILFFIVSLLTLNDYNISWDETLHFRRGQAYLYLFLTGQTDYKKIPEIDLQGSLANPPKSIAYRRSLYQSDIHNGDYFLKDDSGHPPVNGELAALTNYIFFQRLGWMNDIASHHLFNILASTLLVFVVTYFAFETFGTVAAIVAFLSLVVYPLFFGESHFNIKDPPEAAFFAATIWAYYKFLDKNAHRWLLIAGVFFGLAIGTKFNVLFIGLILLPYLLIKGFYKGPINWETFKVSIKTCFFTILAGGISAIIFIGCWPFLWQNFPANLFKITNYYTEIGLGTRYQPDYFFIHGFNTFPVLWILFTTPPVVLVLTLIGVITAIIQRKKYKSVTILWLLWFILPIARVTFPDTVIYGGDRQIMEFLPAMALLSGLGAWQISRVIKFRPLFLGLLIALIFVYPIIVLLKLHPEENVYFNSLIGGLPGAEKLNFPSWGNSFGNAYKGGIDWINKNAEYGSKLALIQGTPANAPEVLIRSDINYQNANFSGINREGEYLMELTFNDTTRAFNYNWDYVEKFLEPVYELKVDNVAILKVWKNDLVHTKLDYQKATQADTEPLKLSQTTEKLNIDIGQTVDLSKLSFNYVSSPNCQSPKSVYVESSIDGKNWIREKDFIPTIQVGYKYNDNGQRIEFYFSQRTARFVQLILDSPDSCLLGWMKPEIEVFLHKN